MKSTMLTAVPLLQRDTVFQSNFAITFFVLFCVLSIVGGFLQYITGTELSGAKKFVSRVVISAICLAFTVYAYGAP